MKKSCIVAATILSATLAFPTTAFAQGFSQIQYLGQSDGYTSVIDWYNDLQNKREEAIGIADEAINMYDSIITEEERELLYSLENRMTTALTFGIYNEAFDQTNELLDELDSQMPKYSTPSYSSGYYGGPEGVLSKSGGVNSFAGRRETWYSSRVAYHYRTGEWTPDANGVYRDADGYVVVASQDHNKGDIVSTSHGEGKVYDWCGVPGTTDIYVNW